MTETARVYGGSLYELAAEEHLEEEILSEMKEIRALFRENPEYPRLLSEPSIPRKERIGLIDAAFGSQAEPYLSIHVFPVFDLPRMMFRPSLKLMTPSTFPLPDTRRRSIIKFSIFSPSRFRRFFVDVS